MGRIIVVNGIRIPVMDAEISHVRKDLESNSMRRILSLTLDVTSDVDVQIEFQEPDGTIHKGVDAIEHWNAEEIEY